MIKSSSRMGAHLRKPRAINPWSVFIGILYASSSNYLLYRRQQRRTLVRDVIVNKLVGIPLMNYISVQTKELVKNEDQADFYKDVLEDLKYINVNLIPVFGITAEQLNAWMSAAQSAGYSLLKI